MHKNQQAEKKLKNKDQKYQKTKPNLPLNVD